MSEQKNEPPSPILRLTQNELTEMFAKGEAKIVLIPSKGIAKEFTEKPHTPDFYTLIFRSIWKEREELLQKNTIDIHITVPPCPYTQEEIDQLEKEARRLGYLPKDLSSQKDRYRLGVFLPEKSPRDYSLIKDNDVTNEENRYGWFDYETNIKSPNEDTTEDELRQIAKKQNRFGMNLNEYIVASCDSELLASFYLDEDRAYSRLLGSRNKRGVVAALFHWNGNLFAGASLIPKSKEPDTGGRLVGLPKK